MSVEFFDKLPSKSQYDVFETEETEHFFSGMTLTRHHIFAICNQSNYEDALDRLNQHFVDGGLKKEQYIGLCAELRFYADFKTKLNLVPALDCGDHADFVGFFKGHFIRFDVTTNLSTKSKQDYTKFKDQMIAVWSDTDKIWSYYIPDSHAGEGFKKVR